MTITVVSSVLSGQDKDVFPFIETTGSWSIAIHNIQVGDYVLVCYACDNPATESSFSSSFVSTSGGIQYLTYIGYEEVTNSGNVSTGIAIFKIAALPPSGDSLSLRIYGPGGAKAMTCYDVKGLVSTDVEDIAITTETGTNPPYNTGSTGTLSQASELVLSAIGIEEETDQLGSWTSGSGYTSTGTQSRGTTGGGGASNVSIASAYSIVTTTDSMQGDMNAGAPDWAALIVTFKGIIGSASVSPSISPSASLSPSGSFSPSASPSPSGLLSNLISYWKCNEGSGSSVKDSVSSHNGSWQGTITWDTGISGSALVSGSSSDYVAVEDHADFDFTSGPFSIAFWGKRNSTGNNTPISKWSNATGGYECLIGSSSEVYFRTGTAGSYQDTYTTTGLFPGTGTWHHVVLTRNGTVCKVYVDGVDRTLTSASHSVVANNLRLCMFERADEIGSEHFYGYLDEIAVWGKTLSSDEVSDLYTNGLPFSSPSASPSISPSSSPSVLQSSSVSPSVSPSLSPSFSLSESVSTSPSLSPSGSFSPSASVSPSIPASPVVTNITADKQTYDTTTPTMAEITATEEDSNPIEYKIQLSMHDTFTTEWCSDYPTTPAPAGSASVACFEDTILVSMHDYSITTWIRYFDGFDWNTLSVPQGDYYHFVGLTQYGKWIGGWTWNKLYFDSGSGWVWQSGAGSGYFGSSTGRGGRAVGKEVFVIRSDGSNNNRLILTTDNGANWSEEQPIDTSAYYWRDADTDGTNRIACIYGGRIYRYNGSSWSETRPKGDVDANWLAVGISGNYMAASESNGRLYYYNSSSWSEIQPEGALDTDWEFSLKGNKLLVGNGHSPNGYLWYYDGSSFTKQEVSSSTPQLYFQPDFDGLYGAVVYNGGSVHRGVIDYDGGFTRESTTDSGFLNEDQPLETHPFTISDTVSFTVQGADALTAGHVYYWHVAGKCPDGNNTYGDYSETLRLKVALVSASISPSHSLSSSASLSPSSSSSLSTSPSISQSISSSVSSSVSSSPSLGVSASRSASPSYSVSPSISPSFSVSPSISGSASISPSLSVSASISESISISPSISPSISSSISPSASISPSISPSFSLSQSPSLSLSTPPYGAVLKVWDGATWQKAILKVYQSGSFTSKVLKVWDGADWLEVDIYG